MDIQKHSRTHQIKRLASHLHRALSGFCYILYLGWPAILVVMFLPGGTLYLGDIPVVLGPKEYALKGLILALYSGGLYLMTQITLQFKRLMQQYMEGHIFSTEAIESVRAALKAGIRFIALSWVHAIAGCIYLYLHNGLLDFSFTTEILIAVIFFGLMYTLLWALEIGCDLNEESEKTI